MELREVITILRKRFVVIAAIPVIALATAAVMVFFIVQPVYEASTTLLVGKTPGEQQIIYQDILANRQIVKTYREIARSAKVMDQVITWLDLDTTADELRRAVDVRLRGDTEIIEIVVEHADPVQAKVIANATADAFKRSVISIMQVDNVVTIDEARVPTDPVKPRKMQVMVVSAFLGALTGLGIAFLAEYMDNTVENPDELEELFDVPVLGVIPEFDKVLESGSSKRNGGVQKNSPERGRG